MVGGKGRGTVCYHEVWSVGEYDAMVVHSLGLTFSNNVIQYVVNQQNINSLIITVATE